MTSSATAALSAVLTSTTAPAEGGGTIFGFDPLRLGMLAFLAVMIFFMFRSARMRKAEAEKAKDSMVPGVEVMTNYGLFGTLLDVDDVANTAHIEIAPGTIVKVHRQTLAKVVEAGAEGEPRSVEEAMAIADREQAERDAADLKGADSAAIADSPKFGERLATDDTTTESTDEGDAPKKSTES